ncbi:MAG TPA: hypothetical protein VKV04_18730 [Verrucomicrobiae bacterium]|nr:hypothetical protein [Verrucomicrobiae bacterium]
MKVSFIPVLVAIGTCPALNDPVEPSGLGVTTGTGGQVGGQVWATATGLVKIAIAETNTAHNKYAQILVTEFMTPPSQNERCINQIISNCCGDQVDIHRKLLGHSEPSAFGPNNGGRHSNDFSLQIACRNDVQALPAFRDKKLIEKKGRPGIDANRRNYTPPDSAFLVEQRNGREWDGPANVFVVTPMGRAVRDNRFWDKPMKESS